VPELNGSVLEPSSNVLKPSSSVLEHNSSITRNILETIQVCVHALDATMNINDVESPGFANTCCPIRFDHSYFILNKNMIPYTL
jgi:hypothetical protein